MKYYFFFLFLLQLPFTQIQGQNCYNGRLSMRGNIDNSLKELTGYKNQGKLVYAAYVQPVVSTLEKLKDDTAQVTPEIFFGIYREACAVRFILSDPLESSRINYRLDSVKNGFKDIVYGIRELSWVDDRFSNKYMEEFERYAQITVVCKNEQGAVPVPANIVFYFFNNEDCSRFNCRECKPRNWKNCDSLLVPNIKKYSKNDYWDSDSSVPVRLGKGYWNVFVLKDNIVVDMKEKEFLDSKAVFEYTVKNQLP